MWKIVRAGSTARGRTMSRSHDRLFTSLARPRLLVLGRHGIGRARQALEELRSRRVSRHDPLPGDERLHVKDVIHPSLDGPVLAVAAVAVGFEDVVGALGELGLVVSAQN